MPAVDPATTTRIQIEITEERVKELNDLMLRCGLSTKKDLFNNAMSVLEWAVEEVEAGKVVASVDRAEQRYEVLRMPALDSAAKRSPRKAASDQPDGRLHTVKLAR